MSDDPERPDADDRSSADDRPDEPLGGVAEKVRDRTGEESVDREATPRDGPLADVATQVDERRRRGRDTTDAFESVDVDELDGEKLWERLADDDGGGPSVSVPAGETVEVDDEWGDDRDVRTIPKETCHGCPHFGEPPTLACTHEGTAILAMPDVDHFRVADCPVVVDDEEIGGLTGDPGDAPGSGESDQREAVGDAADRPDPAAEGRTRGDGDATEPQTDAGDAA